MSILYGKLERCLQILVQSFAYLFPRNKHLIVYGGTWDLFIDNAKYQFIINNESMPEYKHVWLTNKKDIYDNLSQHNFNVVKAHSLRGLIAILRAGFVVFDDGIDYFSFTNLAMGAVRINIWHGVVGKFLTRTPNEKDHVPYKISSRFKDKFLVNHIKRDYIISTNSKQITILSHSFKIPVERILIGGYPRTIPLFSDSARIKNMILKYETENYCSFYNKLEKEKRKKYVYMPTFRDKDKYYLNKAIPDWGKLNEVCSQLNIIIYVKVHRVTPLPELSEFSNIEVLDNKMDIYPLLPLFDRLVTDYSSIMFDFSLLRKPVVLYTFDYEQYIKYSRPLYNHFKELIHSLTRVESFESFLKILSLKDENIVPFPVDRYFEKPKDFKVVQNLIRKLS